MHLAKGLEFGAVAALRADDEVLPLQERIENVGDPRPAGVRYANDICCMSRRGMR